MICDPPPHQNGPGRVSLIPSGVNTRWVFKSHMMIQGCTCTVTTVCVCVWIKGKKREEGEDEGR